MGASPSNGDVSVAVEDLEVRAYEFPTDYQPEQDGTLTWDSTTMVVVFVRAAGQTGIGYTYGHPAIARFIDDLLRGEVVGKDALAVGNAWASMMRAGRNDGLTGQTMMAVSAVDIALWDLKARLLDHALVDLLGPFRSAIPAYGSGGFTSYPIDRLEEQVRGWVKEGFRAVKIKIGRDPQDDVERLQACRDVMNDGVELFVDANGAYDRKQALAWASRLADYGVSWLEEPVSSEDLEGLRLLRDRGPAGMDITAGEYGYTPAYFARMISAGAVDVVQPDVTRCGGITGLSAIGGICQGSHVPLSGHTAPQIHAHALCAIYPARHLEYFHDHARIEIRVFDGALQPVDGSLHPDRSRPGLGVEFKAQDAKDYLIYRCRDGDERS